MIQPSTKLTLLGSKSLPISSAVIGEIALASKYKKSLRPILPAALATLLATRFAANGTTIETTKSVSLTRLPIDGTHFTPTFSALLRVVSLLSLAYVSTLTPRLVRILAQW